MMEGQSSVLPRVLKSYILFNFMTSHVSVAGSLDAKNNLENIYYYIAHYSYSRADLLRPVVLRTARRTDSPEEIKSQA